MCTVGRKKLPAERGAVLVGLIISVAILGLMFSQFRAATSVPSIHNISTDTENPPQFDKIIPLREAQGANPLQYDTATLADAQRKAYPQVQPLISNQSAQEMIARAANVMQGMGLEVVDINPAAGRVEATDTTFWFVLKLTWWFAFDPRVQVLLWMSAVYRGWVNRIWARMLSVSVRS